MKKIILSLVLSLAVPAITLAYFQPATLTNGAKKIVVYTQDQANRYFGLGYSLDGGRVGGSSVDHYFKEYFNSGVVTGGSVTSISTSSASYTLSAKEVCDSAYIKVTPLGASATVTFPATSTSMFSKCLPKIGSFIDINYQSTATSTVIAAGAGGTLGYSASTTVAAGKHGLIRVLRDSASTYDLFLVNIAN